MTTTSAATAPKAGAWRPYQYYVLFVLMLVNTSNYLDRGILGILQQPIKDDLRLTDWQLGILGGPAFAILYSVAGLPIARLAERKNRVTILSAALAFWSTMTALCGVAGAYGQLLLFRLGVGAGEGACTPVTHAILADSFTARQRGMAMAVMTTSIPFAHMIAPLAGGLIAHTWGWRAAFIAAGLPGLLIAVLMKTTVRDGRAKDEHGAPVRPQTSKFLADVKLIFSIRAFLFLFIASAFLGQAITGTNSFSASYFIREHHMTVAQAGIISAVGLGVAGLCGTMLGGFLADRFAGAHGRSYAYVCALAAGLAGVSFLGALASGALPLAVTFFLIANVASEMKNGPNFAAVQNLAPPHMRATASAVLMVGVIVIGAGFGPIEVGAASDFIASRNFPAALGAFSVVCPGGKALANAAPDIVASCKAASAAGLRGGLVVPCIAYMIAMLFFLLSGRAIRAKLQT